MPRYKLRTLLIVLALGPIAIWMGFRTVLVSLPPETIQSPAEFADLMVSGNVVIHMDADWSLQAAANRPAIARLRSRVALDPRCSTACWRRFDETDNTSPLWRAMDDWLGDQLDDHNAGRPLQSGYGSLIWIKDGRIVDSLPYASESADDLLARTLKAFSGT